MGHGPASRWVVYAGTAAAGRRARRRRHPLFVYFMQATHGACHIGCASDPLARARRRHAPWRLEMVVGPFYQGARAFQSQWRRESRKPAYRLAHGFWKAVSYRAQGLCVWARCPARLLSLGLRSVRTKRQRLRSAFDRRRRLTIRTRPPPSQPLPKES